MTDKVKKLKLRDFIFDQQDICKNKLLNNWASHIYLFMKPIFIIITTKKSLQN